MAVAFDPTSLRAGDHPLRHRPITLAAGQNLKRGAVLGRVTLGAVTVAAAGGNTGVGVLTMDVNTPVKSGAKAGAYKATCITAELNGGTFRVEDPDGLVLGDVAVAATFDDDIMFVIADGAIDFAVGDVFTITVAAGAGTYKLSLAAATDGSEAPDCVLAQDVNATDGAVNCSGYFAGELASELCTFGAGHTAGSVNEVFRSAGREIYLRSVGAVA